MDKDELIDKEELLGGLIALIVMILIGWAFYKLDQHENYQTQLLRKYPECLTAGNPYICIRYKEMMQE